MLTFGKLSLLEICTVVGGALEEFESISERVCTLKMEPSVLSSVQKLAGIHKFVPLMTQIQADGSGIEEFADKVADRLDVISNFSLSGYDLGEANYEDFVGQILGALRSRGFKKVHLLRTERNELHADQVISRESVDAVVFPYRSGFYLGLTSYVPDTVSLRESGLMKPVPHSEISLSPRLARVLVNLSGIAAGETLLDPFCGSGTILAEGLLKSLRCFGVDSRRRLIDEARLNLRWISQKARGGSFRLVSGDARELHRILDGRKVDAVATEPILLPELKGKPNLDTAKEMMDNAGEVYADAMASISDVVRPGGRIVVVVPIVQTIDGNEIYVGLDGRPLGLTLHQPGPISFQYPVRLSFESTRWVKRAVYVFEVRS